MGNYKNVYIGAYLEVKTDKTLWGLTKGTPFENTLSDITPEYWEESPEDSLYLIGNMSDKNNGCIETDVEGLVSELDPLTTRSHEVNFSYSYREEIELLKSVVGRNNVIVKFGVIIYYS